MRNIILLFTIVCIAVTANADLLAQDRSGVEQVGRIYNYWRAASDIAVQGNYAYLAARISGLQIVDISNPEDLSIVGYYDDNPSTSKKVCVSDNFAYLEDEEDGLLVIDISDPQNPYQVGACDTLTKIADMFFSDDYIYVVEYKWRDGGLGVIDVSDPTNPHLVSYLVTPGEALDVFVVGDYVYIGEEPIWRDFQRYGGGLRTIDISNPENPEEVGFYRTGEDYDIFDLSVSGDYAYLACYYNLKVVDISNPANPHLDDVYDFNTSLVFLSGNHAFVYTVDYGHERIDGIRVIDITDPTRLEEVSFFEMQSHHSSIFASNDYLYMSGLLITIVDSSDPTNLHQVGSLVLDDKNIKNVCVSGGYAYITGYNIGFRALDISDPTNINMVGIYAPAAGHVLISGDLAYVAYNGLTILDVSNPARPSLIGRHYMPAITFDFAITGDFIYAANDTSGLRVIDVSDPENPDEVFEFDVDQVASGASVTDDDQYLFLTAGDILVFDITNPSNPEHLVTYPGSTYQLFILGNYAYALRWDEGIVVLDKIDITDPQEITILGTYVTEEWTAQQLFVSGDYCYLTVREYGGLHVINVSDPENMHEVGYYDTPGTAYNLTVAGNLVFVADGTNLSIYDCSEALYILEPLKSTHGAFMLLPSYPNPFNSTTTIRYELPNPGSISIQVYNPLGDKITTLFQGYQHPGIHTTTLTADNLPSGLYFVQLNADTKTITQKVMLVK